MHGGGIGRWVYRSIIFALVAIFAGTTVASARGGGHGGWHSDGTVHVNGYTRSDGTYVHGYYRSSPGSGSYAGSSNYNSTESHDSSSSEHASPVYTWEDDKGLHATNDRTQVPKQYLNEHGVGKSETAKHEASPSVAIPPAISPTKSAYPSIVKRHRSIKASGVVRDGRGRIKRSAAAKHAFQKSHPCPSTGTTSGACPGYVIDHIVPLKRGGPDLPGNMQWQTIQAAKAKDRWE